MCCWNDFDRYRDCTGRDFSKRFHLSFASEIKQNRPIEGKLFFELTKKCFFKFSAKRKFPFSMGRSMARSMQPICEEIYETARDEQMRQRKCFGIFNFFQKKGFFAVRRFVYTGALGSNILSTAVVVVEWLSCLPSTPTNRVQIAPKPTVFMKKLCLKRSKINKKGGQFKKQIVIICFQTRK